MYVNVSVTIKCATVASLLEWRYTRTNGALGTGSLLKN